MNEVFQIMQRFVFENYQDWVEEVQWQNGYVEIHMRKCGFSIYAVEQARQIASTLHYLFCVKYQKVHVHGNAIIHSFYYIENDYTYLFQLFEELRQRNMNFDQRRERIEAKPQ